MKVHTRTQNHSMASFALLSLLLFSALLMVSSFAAHAQQSVAALQGVKAGTQVAAQAGQQTSPHAAPTATPVAIAHNRTSAKELDAAFNRGDTNHDGKLDRKEAKRFPALAQRFDKIDTDHDHFISRVEFSRAAGSD